MEKSKMNRRSFLTAILATCSAPAIVRADSLMRIVPRDPFGERFWIPPGVPTWMPPGSVIDLMDYEEGWFTPTYVRQPDGVKMQFRYRMARYTRTGGIVLFSRGSGAEVMSAQDFQKLLC
jgi:hypothetical protein